MTKFDNYERDGFIICRNFYSNDEVKLMLEDAIKIEKISSDITKTAYICGSKFVIPFNRENNTKSFLRAEWVTHIAQSSSILTTTSKITSALREVTGHEKFEQIIFQLNTKFPLDNISYPWHQDKQMDKGSWTSQKYMDQFVLANIAISKCSIKNGALRVLCGSHKLGPLKSNTITDPKTIAIYSNRFPEVILELDPGDIAFFSPYLLHSSQENHDSSPRRMYVVGYAISGSYIRKNYFSTINF